MDADQLAFLTSAVGMRAIVRAAMLPLDRLTRLTRLRREYSASHAMGIVELLELRARARAKFTHADRMFFTPEGLEQSTGETIAAYRANHFPADLAVLDACCGIGGDALALSSRASVLAVDRNPVTAACALANARLLAALSSSSEQERQGAANISASTAASAEEAGATLTGEGGVRVLCADVTALDLVRMREGGIGAAFFDPSRRIESREGRKRARNAEDYLPPLSWLNALREHFPCVGVKVSPAIDDATLQLYGGRVEFIAEGSECKEAVLWFGQAAETFAALDNSLADGTYCATIVQKGAQAQTLGLQFEEDIPLSTPRAWLFEPNPAVIRAHLVSQIALRISGAQIDPDIAYLTADAFYATPFATAYRILDWMPFHLKNVQSWLRANRRRVSIVKKRGVEWEPEDVRKKLASPLLADCPPAVLVLTRRKEQTLAILCDLPAPAA